MFKIATLTSPKIFQRKACFTFQYFAHLATIYSDNSGVFVFVRNASNGQFLPLWHKNIVNDPEKWHTVRILLDLESGFDKVSHSLAVIVYRISQ